jgi:hypothetical protein
MKKILTIFLCAFSIFAHAAFKDGNKLYDQLVFGDDKDMLNALGYITGVVDDFYGVIICPPPNATAGQMVDIVKKELILNPAIRTNPANIIVGGVLANTWPCAKKSKGNSL